MLFWVSKGTFDVIVKKIELFTRIGNTKILYPVYVEKKYVAIYYFGSSLSIEYHVDTGGVPLRYKRVVLDKPIVFSRLGKETSWSQVDIFDESS